MAEADSDPSEMVTQSEIVRSIPALADAEAPPSSMLLGLVVGGRFELLQKLGSGAAGEVFRARDLNTETLVALKVLRSSKVRNEVHRARMRREVQAAWKVTHPGVVRIYDLYELEGGVCAISM